MKSNYFRCPNCGSLTRHIPLSAREYSAINGDSKGEEFFSTICDGIGVTYATSKIIGITCYKCSNCGRTCIRNGAGTDITSFEGHATIIEKVIGKKIFPWIK